MDNLTHTLAGIVVADAAMALRNTALRSTALRARSGAGIIAQPAFRGAALFISVLANNGPDFDFLYAGVTAGKLGYLLHHRGHTHTLVAAVPLTLLWVGLVALAFRLRRLSLDRSDYLTLIALAAIGSVLHVLMDYGNNYGVHPFWPFHNGWFYGDAMFIIEPWFMLILAGMAVGASTSRVGRGILCVCIIAVLALAWVHPLGGVVLGGLLGVFAALWLAWMWRADVRRRWRSGAIALSALWFCLLIGRHEARASVRAALAADPELRIESIGSSPAPGNPLCWWVLAVQRSEERYVVRQALVSSWPAVNDVKRCQWMSGANTAPLQSPTAPQSAETRNQISWGPEFRAPIRQLIALHRTDCAAAAFLRFARVPFWLHDGERATLIGDLRYDRSPDIDFAELELEPNESCPEHEPPWRPPLSIFGR